MRRGTAQLSGQNQKGRAGGVVSKVTMICPFSRSVCQECPIYRGRHAGFCFAEGYRKETAENAPRPKRTAEAAAAAFGTLLDELFNPNVMSNIEDDECRTDKPVK